MTIMFTEQKTMYSYIILLTGTRRVRLTQRYNGIRVFGVSTSVELDEVGQPTGSSLGHVINGIHYDVSYMYTACHIRISSSAC